MPPAARGLLVAVVLVVLVVGLVVGAGALLAGLLRPGELAAQERCRAEVASPDDPDVLLSASLAPDQTANAALVVGLANRRGLPARAATIGVATAIQESGLRNIDYGDRDSLGLFQQRPSQGWGSEAQVQDPVYSTGAFYDALVEVDGWQDLEVTVAAQEVQRSGFPEAYADHEPEGRALASSLYGLSEASLWCELRPVEEPGDPAAALDGLLAALDPAGPPGWQVAATPGDGTVVLAATGAQPERAAWALAQSVVAHAAAHDVVGVRTGGSAWSRDDGTAGWVDAEPVEAGTVVVEVAAAGA
ncbi:hypothetical protein [Aquipuribacter nitratireducens]|uniref:Uncharacterized protein n=1 Tax=Aquipuribacter nitratireducens TaxID=650104 RepID=A0ABW0GLD9_9MICO